MVFVLLVPVSVTFTSYRTAVKATFSMGVSLYRVCFEGFNLLFSILNCIQVFSPPRASAVWFINVVFPGICVPGTRYRNIRKCPT